MGLTARFPAGNMAATWARCTLVICTPPMKRAARGLPFRCRLIALVSDGASCTQTGLRTDELGEEALTLLLPAWSCR